jgi:hypothetical protein
MMVTFARALVSLYEPCGTADSMLLLASNCGVVSIDLKETKRERETEGIAG